jgi:catalase
LLPPAEARFSLEETRRSIRRNHAASVWTAGYFDSNGDGVRLSKAAVFRPGRVPVIGHLSLAGGQPYISPTCLTARRRGAVWR